MAYILQSRTGDSESLYQKVKGGNRKQARKAIRALFPGQKVKFSLDRVYVGGRKFYYYCAQVFTTNQADRNVPFESIPIDDFHF